MKAKISQKHIEDLKYIENEMMFIESSLIDIQDMWYGMSFAFDFNIRD